MHLAYVLLLITVSLAHAVTIGCDQTACRTAHDTIPRLDLPATISSVLSGPWSSPLTWDQARIPTATDRVAIQHTVLYDDPDGQAGVIGITTANGMLTFANTRATRLTVDTILVLMQGSIVRQPGIATTEIIFRDTPIDATKDPSQYGGGLLSFDATVNLQGIPKAPTFVRLATEPKAGDTTLTLSQAPTGWSIGDRVVVPDTRQLTEAEVDARTDLGRSVRRLQSQSEVRTITAITNAVLTLDSPLTYAHSGARDSQGHLDFLPHVGNLSRDLVLRSANPTGTRGHVLFTHLSDVNVQYATFLNLGRTKAEPLDNTTYDTNGVPIHIGTNQIGRYPLHIHHTYGTCTPKPYQFMLVGNVVEESGRWGLTIHDSHYSLVRDNVLYNIKGAALATEDGSETANLIEHNFAVRVENKTILNSDESTFDPLGRLGTGYWFRGPNNAVVDNVAADVREGLGWYIGSAESGPTSALVPVNIPNYPCADTTVAGQFTVVNPLVRIPNRAITGNETYSTTQFGHGFWFFGGFGPPLTNMKIWHARENGWFMKYGNPTLDGLTIRNARGEGTGIGHNNNGDGRPAFVSHLDIQGVDRVYARLGQLALAPAWTITDSVFASKSGFVMDNQGQSNQSPTGGSLFTFVNPRFLPMPGLPLKTFQLPWSMIGDNAGLTIHQFIVRGYQGDPAQNFSMYYLAQDPAALAPVGDPVRNPGGCPEPGLTNQQCWDKYHIAASMELAPCTDTTTHPEILGFTCPITGAILAAPTQLRRQ